MKTNLFKSLLVATMAVLCGGTSAQAATETYDFASFVAQGTPSLKLTSTSVEQSGKNAKTVYVVGNQTSGSITLDLNRIALCSDANTNNTMRWIWRADKKNAYKNHKELHTLTVPLSLKKHTSIFSNYHLCYSFW